MDELEKQTGQLNWNRKNLKSIHTRIIFWFTLIAIVPTIIISLTSIWVGYRNGRQQVILHLESVATLKEKEIDNWLEIRRYDLIFIMNETYVFDRIMNTLNLGPNMQYYEYYSKALQKSLQQYLKKNPDLLDISILDGNGSVILSTDDSQIARQYGDQSFFRDAIEYSESQVWISKSDQENATLVSGVSIENNENEKIGVLIIRASSERIAEYLIEPTGMGETGKAYLIDSEYQLFNGSTENLEYSRNFHSQGIDYTASTHINNSGIFKDYCQERVIGVYRWLPRLNMVLVVEQNLSESINPILTNLWVDIFVAIVTLIAAISLSLLIANNVATPIVKLANTAAQITAGDLNQVAVIEQDDEIGFLAVSFNRMTAQLRESINSLERRVEERTSALSRRALQLETSASVSRQITSVLKIDELIDLIVELIRKRFGYYGVSIYLLEEHSNGLILHSFSGEVSPALGKLELNDQTLNGKVIINNAPILVNDVSLEMNYTYDEMLPNTKSELVIPLRMGNEVIGTLDMISDRQNAFMEEDVTLSQSLGDQIAIAIQNARLYEKSHQLAVIQERTRLARDLHDSVTQLLYSLSLLVDGWRQMAIEGEKLDIQEVLSRIAQLNQQMLIEMRLLINELRLPILEDEGLLNAIQQRLDDVENRVGINARLITEELVSLPPNIEDGLYRIILEALNNSLKHSQANQVVVFIGCNQNGLNLEIKDNGKGFDWKGDTQKSGGMGLRSMYERAELLGGKLEIISELNKGTIIRVKLGVI